MRPRQRFPIRLIVVAVQAVLLANSAATAQTVNDAGPVETIHVSTAIIQIPLLILTQDGRLPSLQLAASDIEVKLDGEWFHPQYVRQEGQDPIDLAVLADLSHSDSDFTARLIQALSSLDALSLIPRDHVSLFVMDCSSVRMTSIPAGATQIADAVRSAIEGPGKGGVPRNCKESGRLWDTLAYMTARLEDTTGRRAILAITDGRDTGSKITLSGLIDRAQSRAVTIFGLDPAYPLLKPYFSPPPHEQNLALLAASTGGLRFVLNSAGMERAVRWVVTMLRGRYIVEFPRPSDVKSGTVRITARIAGASPGKYAIRIGGKSVPLPSAAENSTPAQPVKIDER